MSDVTRILLPVYEESRILTAPILHVTGITVARLVVYTKRDS